MSIESVLQKYQDQIMSLPNVTGIAIGKKDGTDVIKVFVAHKVPKSTLKADQIIPKRLDGYETEIEAIGIVTAQISK